MRWSKGLLVPDHRALGTLLPSARVLFAVLPPWQPDSLVQVVAVWDVRGVQWGRFPALAVWRDKKRALSVTPHRKAYIFTKFVTCCTF